MSEVSRVQEPDEVRARVDRRDELAYKIQRAVEGSPDTIRYDEDDWTRIADVVMDLFDDLQRGAAREVVEQAECQVLTEAADFIERHVSQVGPASQALAPGQSFAVKLLRDRAALRGGRRG